MRIISQDGAYDFPYERCSLWSSDANIVATPIGEPNTDVIIAHYSSKEKVKKAMQMLHNQYSYIWELEHIASAVYYRDNPIVFKFPGEDEI